MAADALFMDFQRKRLTGALVVGNTLGLGCHAVLGSEGQNDHGCHEGHHIIDVAGPVQLRKEGGV